MLLSLAFSRSASQAVLMGHGLEPLNGDLPAIAKVEVWSGGRVVDHGTGFLVAADHALTAWHVVATAAGPKGDALVLHFDRLTTPQQVDASVVGHDSVADWALLKLSAAPTGVEPLVLGPPPQPRSPFRSFGYSTANPKDGLVFSGFVEDPNATCDGTPALQLYSLQAAAGTGAPIQGLSGAPCIVEGRVAGIVRSFISKGGAAVAGLIYATPARLVLDSPARSVVRDDVCAALPSLPASIGPPAEPFRYLDFYRREDAQVFFGRCAELHRICRRILDPAGKPVLFLYGQSGVGKSSIIEAGLRPRLEAQLNVSYFRRHTGQSLTETLASAVGASSSDASAIAASWRDLELARLPALLIFDQLEEIFTSPRPHSSPTDELNEFFSAVHTFLSMSGAPPKSRMLLSFRKSWLPEIDAVRADWELPADAILLGPLQRAAIPEVVHGIERHPLAKAEYHATVSPDLGETIARDLATDSDSAIAPLLQILMTELYREAKNVSHSAPALQTKDYEERRAKGLSLEAFLDRQLAAIPKRDGYLSHDGLLLDLLAFHTSDLGTALRRSESERRVEYADKFKEAEVLVQALRDSYLLVDPPEDAKDALKATRLAHDTLGPIIRDRFARSMLPGQRARRILENRGLTPELDDSNVLDEFDLTWVEDGVASMRRLTETEIDLIDRSRKARASRRRARRRTWITSLALVVTAAVAIVFALSQNAERVRQEAALREAEQKDANSLRLRTLNHGEFDLLAPEGAAIVGVRRLPSARGDQPWEPGEEVGLGLPLPAAKLNLGLPVGYYVVDYELAEARYAFGIRSEGAGVTQTVQLPTPSFRPGFRFLPGGTVPVGDLLGLSQFGDEGPVTAVKLDPFWIANERSADATWDSAQAEARQNGARLPSAAEWEWAAILGAIPLGEWEWTRTRPFPAPYDREDGRENEWARDTDRVLKGGPMPLAEGEDPEDGRVWLSNHVRPSRWASAGRGHKNRYRLAASIPGSPSAAPLLAGEDPIVIAMGPNDSHLSDGAQLAIRKLAYRWCVTPDRKQLMVTAGVGPPGSSEYNLQLSERYGRQVQQLLETEGVAWDHISARGVGEERASSGTTYYEALRDYGVKIEVR